MEFNYHVWIMSSSELLLSVIGESLARKGLFCQTLSTEGEINEALKLKKPDIILLDYNFVGEDNDLRVHNGLDTQKTLYDKLGKFFPIILMTDEHLSDKKDVLSKFISEGGYDYIKIPVEIEDFLIRANSKIGESQDKIRNNAGRMIHNLAMRISDGVNTPEDNLLQMFQIYRGLLTSIGASFEDVLEAFKHKNGGHWKQLTMLNMIMKLTVLSNEVLSDDLLDITEWSKVIGTTTEIMELSTNMLKDSDSSVGELITIQNVESKVYEIKSLVQKITKISETNL